MSRDRIRLLAATAALIAAAAGAGCGFGEGETSKGEVTLTVTRDYGEETMLEATAADPPESETVIRLLDGEADITTRFGGGFVNSIEGVEGEIADGRRRDWFFYLNGIESSTGGRRGPGPRGGPDLVGLPRLDRCPPHACGRRLLAGAVRAGVGRRRAAPGAGGVRRRPRAL